MDIFEFERSYGGNMWVRNEVYTGDMLYIVYLLRSTVHSTALPFAVLLLIHSTFVQCSEENISWLKAVFMGTPWCIVWSRLVVSIVLIWLAPRASVSLEPVAKTDNVTEGNSVTTQYDLISPHPHGFFTMA